MRLFRLRKRNQKAAQTPTVIQPVTRPVTNWEVEAEDTASADVPVPGSVAFELMLPGVYWGRPVGDETGVRATEVSGGGEDGGNVEESRGWSWVV